MNIKRQDLNNKRVLLIDDIATTGATLEAASHELMRAGTGSVVALTAGLTPLSGSNQESADPRAELREKRLWSF
jgi:hypoxanthine phosphoribosyltransferase